MVTTNQTRPKPQHRSSSSTSPVQQQKTSDKKSTNKSTQRRTQSLTPESLMHEQDSAHRRPSSPVMSSTPRLSIADRFMSSSGYQHSPLTSSPLSYTSPIPTESEQDTGSTYSNGARTNNIHANSVTRRVSSNSSSITNDNGPNPSRLTIASAFMKSSSSSISSLTAAKQNGSNTNGTIHPLDNISDSASGSLDLNLHLTTPSSTTPSLYLENRYSRPFGSQDTLVSSDLDNKKQQYQRQKLHGSIEEEEHYGNSPNDYYQRQQHDHHSDGDDDGHENESNLSSITRHGDEENDLEFQQNKVNEKHMDDDEWIGEPRGCWIGCCFLSCGDRSSSKKAINKQAQLKQQQKQQQKQQKQQQQHRTCGRRWRVFALFLSTLFLIILSCIFWPRTPLIRIEGASLLSPAKVTETSQGAMLGNVQFESQWMVNFTVDNRQNWLLPTRLVQFHLLVKDALTGNVVGKGFQNDHPESLVLDPRAISTVQLGVYLDYQARDVSDTTFSSLKKACVISSSTTTTKRRSLLMARGDGNETIATTPMDQHNTNNTTNHTMTTSGSNTNNNQTISTSPPPAPPAPPASPAAAASKEHESLSLLFWVTLHIWGLDVFGYKPTVMVAPATGGFVCPLS
ncbi:unnamed protein product [Absidia cylindrospora]